MASAPLHIETPLLESLPLGRCTGGRVWLKLEALQPSASFKLRGLGYACQRHAERGKRRFVSSSGGNAGLAVAYAGRRLAIPVTVVVPESTTGRARRLIEAEGAEVIVRGASWQEAHAHALSLLGDDAAYLHPFDDPLVWEGNATLVDEVLAAGVEPDRVLLSVGGGGLLCGVAHGLQRAARTKVPIVAAETWGAESFHRALAAGEPVELEAITSVATSLGARKVAARALEVARRFEVSSRVVTDREAVDACLRFADDHRVLVEPACGAALALAYAGDASLRGAQDLLLIVCGGAGVSHDELRALKEKLG